MMNPKMDYYALLGIPSTATPEEITRGYRKRILEVHLDKRPQGEDSDVCYKTIEAHRVLSDRNLRAKYDIQRDSSFKSNETFIPAGYICYDVGQSQMSKLVLQNISDWKKEFDEVKSASNGFSDNFFECFSNLMGQVMDPEEDKSSSLFVEKEEHYFCSVCDKKFLTETHHWEEILYPYINMFSCDKSGVGSLIMYFESLLGAKLFNWEPRYLPSQLLGIWGSSEQWGQLDVCDKTIGRIFDLLPSADDFPSVQDHIDYIKETFLSDSETNEEIYPPDACKVICWLLENQDDQEIVVNKVNDDLAADNLDEILYICSIMKKYLECGDEEWQELASEALEGEQPELAMLWTKIGIQFGDLDEESEWYELGLKIHEMDPVLAHFCFLFGGYESEEDWEALADTFTQKKDHYASMEYYLNKGNLSHLLEKSKKLLKSDPAGARIYRTVYFSLKAKSLLAVLQKRAKEDLKSFDKELGELIQLITDLAPNNPLEGFRIISNTWPKSFETKVGYGMHRATVEFLRQSGLTTKSFNLILGVMHFLPKSEVDQQLLTTDCIQLTIEQMEQSMKTSDFDSLTDILLHLSNRSLPGALKVLADMEGEQQEALISKSPHLTAMRLLIKGTVSKVQQDWMEAMSEYQNALLCSPECMHRVLPCISKLSQDIEFHEAVVGEVQSEVKELKELFDSEEYPEVDTYSSNRNSLVFSDVVPQVDFGYKNSISKIQPDMDKIDNMFPPPEPMDAPPVETNTPLITLDKNEEAIESGQGGPLAQLNAALSYIDLLKALPLPFQPGPIVMAASHFLRAMDETTDTGSLFAYRNAILLMAENLLKIDRKTQATIQHCLTHKHMLSILLSAHEKLSKSFCDGEEEDSSSEEVEEESEDEETEEEEYTTCNSDDEGSQDRSVKIKINKKPAKSPKTPKPVGIDLIKTSEATLISKFLKNVVNFPKIEPLAKIPTLNCSDLVYVETLGNSFLNQFCSEKVGQKHQSLKIPKHLAAYTHFLEVWKGRSTLADFGAARLKAMEELVALKGWTLEDVEDLMGFPMLNLTDDGWSSEYRTELLFPSPSNAYRSIDGFKINFETGELKFILTKDKQNVFSSGNLFDTQDIVEIFSNGIEVDSSTLSLESPDLAQRSHPFKEAKFTLKEIESKVPNYFQTLTRAAMLICYLSSGLEICSKSPFFMKRTDEGLLNRLEEHLQYLLRPCRTRKEEDEFGGKKSKHPELDIPNRFWLNMAEVFEEEEIEGSTLTYKVGEVRAQVKMNCLVMTLNGTKASLSPEAAFARDFTRHFDEVGNCFPELLRLKELIKISVIYTKLKGVLGEKMTLMEQNGRSKEELSSISRVCDSIKALGITPPPSNVKELDGSVKLRRKPNSRNNSGGRGGPPQPICSWLPASFCNNLDSEPYEVTAGVRMTPEVTYGPVTLPSSAILISAKDLMQRKIKRKFM